MTSKAAPAKAELSPTDLIRLEYLWMHSEFTTLTAFAKAHKLNAASLRSRAKGWRARKEALNPYGTQIPDGVGARRRLLTLWWRVLDDLSASMKENDEARIKTLSSVAGILKAAHAGVGGLLSLAEEADLTPIIIEGLHAETL